MLHLDLKEHIEATFNESQLTSVTLRRDALELGLANGVDLTLRIISENEYSMSWRWGDVGMRIDTAPLHDKLATYPNHLHALDGTVVADPVTEIGAEPWRNVRVLIERLLEQPLLGYEPSFAKLASD